MSCYSPAPMIEYRIEDDFDVTAEQYWDAFFSQEYNDALWEELEVDWELLELTRSGEGEGETLVRRMMLTPRRDVPAALKKLVKDGIRYEEKNEWSKRDSSMKITITPNFGANKFEHVGVFSVKDLGEGKCRRIFEAKCSCAIPLVGKAIEKHIVGEVKDSYAASTKFNRAYFKKLG